MGKQFNQNITRLDPNAPTGPSGPSPASGSPHSNSSGPQGGCGVSCAPNYNSNGTQGGGCSGSGGGVSSPPNIGGGVGGASGASSIPNIGGVGGASGASSIPNIGGAGGGIPIILPITSNGWYYNITIPPMAEKTKVKISDKEGCDCIKCKEYYPYAEPNQEDGTLICFSCRNGY
jgi:hypothetical protein